MSIMEKTKLQIKQAGAQFFSGKAFGVEEEGNRIQFNMAHLPHSIVCEYNQIDGWFTYLTASREIIEHRELDVAYSHLSRITTNINEEYGLDQRAFAFQYGFN